MRILIKNARIVDPDGNSRLGCIAIENTFISYLGIADNIPEGFIPQRIIDAEGLVATPGLVNGHTHAAMSLLRGYADDLPLMEWLAEKIWPIEAQLTEEDVYWGSLLAVVEMIKSGTTTFADQYFSMDAVAQAVQDSGMRASLSRGLIGIAPGAQQSLNEACRFAEKWQGKAGGRITTMLGPHAPYTCPPAYLKEVIKAAKNLKVGLHIHVAETKTEVEQITSDYGCSPVAFLDELGLFEVPVLAAHCVHLTDRDIAILAKNKVGVVHNPQSNMKLGSGIAPVVKLLNAGVVVGLGTDSAASNNDLNMVEEMRTAAYLQKVAAEDSTVIPAFQAIKMGTYGGAAALGLAAQTGELAVGKKADIVLWDFTKAHLTPVFNDVAHLVYSAGRADPVTALIDGKPVMEDRCVLTVAENDILDEATRCAKGLLCKLSRS